MSREQASAPEPPWPPIKRGRGRPPTLSRELVITAAIKLVEADGFDQLSLRRLADELGTGATSVYWHVRDKGQLLDLIIDELIGRITIPDAGGAAARLTAFASSTFEVLTAHPGLAEMILVRGGAGPNGVRQAEKVLSILHEAGIPDHQLLDAYHTLLVYVNGFTIATRAGTPDPGGGDSDVGAYLRTLQPDSVPMLTRAARSAAGTTPQRFRYGLTALLEGLLLQPPRADR